MLETGYFGTLTFDLMFFLASYRLFVRQLVSAVTAVASAAATHVGFVVKMCFLCQIVYSKPAISVYADSSKSARAQPGSCGSVAQWIAHWTSS